MDPSHFNFENIRCLSAMVLLAILHVPSFVNCLHADIVHRKNQNKCSCIICSMANLLQFINASIICRSDLYDRLEYIEGITFNQDTGPQEFLHRLIESSHQTFLSRTPSMTETPISKLFYGTLRSIAKCQCETEEEYKFEPLQLNINEAETIQEALKNHQVLSDAAQVCPICDNVPATKELSFHQHPAILCIELNRSDYKDGNIEKRIQASLEIYITYVPNYILKYRLVSMVFNPKNTRDSDHYAAIVHTKAGKYIYFDADAVESQLIYESALFKENPYIVFYELISSGHCGNDDDTTYEPPTKKVKRNDDDSVGTPGTKGFSCTMKELCLIAGTNSKLEEIANTMFSDKYKLWIFNRKSISELVRNRSVMKKILENFGKLISAFRIEVIPQENVPLSIMNMAISHCRENIKLLQLIEISHKNCELTLKSSFPNLKHFQWECKECSNCNDKECNSYFFKNFVEVHNQLEKIRIMWPYALTFLLLAIADNCKQLVELDITQHWRTEFKNEEVIKENALKKLETLQKLKKLRIHFPGYNMTEFVKHLKHLVNLESLEIVGAHADSYFISAISDIRTLHDLRLADCDGAKYLNPLSELIELKDLSIKVERNEKVDLNVVNLIESLINLETLNLEIDTFKMDKSTYYQLMEIVQDRSKNSIKITCGLVDFSVYFLQNKKIDGQQCKIILVSNNLG